MTKSELIARLSQRHPWLPSQAAEDAVKLILESIAKAIAHDERTEVRGFGSFGLNYRPARNGRNPKTGEAVAIPAKHVPYFKAGKELRKRVDFLH